MSDPWTGLPELSFSGAIHNARMHDACEAARALRLIEDGESVKSAVAKMSHEARHMAERYGNDLPALKRMRGSYR